MFANLLTNVQSWWHGFYRVVTDTINHLEPSEYFAILISTALFGWLLLRSVNNR